MLAAQPFLVFNNFLVKYLYISCIRLLRWHSIVPQSGLLKQQTFILPQSWILESKSQTGRVGLWQGIYLWLAGTQIFTVFSYGLSSVPAHSWCLFLFCRDTSFFGMTHRALSLWSHWTWIVALKSYIPVTLEIHTTYKFEDNGKTLIL
jgi:hypothetical protein